MLRDTPGCGIRGYEIQTKTHIYPLRPNMPENVDNYLKKMRI